MATESEKPTDAGDQQQVPNPDTSWARQVAQQTYEVPVAPTGGDRPYATKPVADAAPAPEAPRLHVYEFPEAAQRVLERIDHEHQGYVTKEQLGAAVEDPSFKGKDAQALMALYQNFDKLHNLSNHENWYETGSITRGDLDKFKELSAIEEKRQAGALALSEWAQSNLPRFYTERGSDGTLRVSQERIEAALKDPKTLKEDKDRLDFLNSHFADIAGESSGVSLKDLTKYYQHGVFTDTPEARLRLGVDASLESVRAGAQTPDISRDLYADKHLLRSIQPDAISQGSLGDCYFEAALVSVVASRPEVINDSIKDNHDGTFTVTFPGAKDEPLIVKSPTDAELGLYNQGSKYGTWASVMEKAYGEYCQKHFWRRSPSGYISGVHTPQEAADYGGAPASVVFLLTGNDSHGFFSALTRNGTILHELENAFSQHPPKVTTANIFGWSEGNTADGFRKLHAYGVIGFQPDGKGDGTVTVYDPGARGPHQQHRYSMPLSTFIRNFDHISIED